MSVYYYSVCVSFFFFKQKTAYEMRISDWSSDVCSSDLGDWYLALASYNWGEGSVKRAMEKNAKAGLPAEYATLNMPDETRNYVPKLQIGRASCRERVCQYV